MTMSEVPHRRPFQFGIRHILVLTAIMAALFALAKNEGVRVLLMVDCAMVAALVIGLLVNHALSRLPGCPLVVRGVVALATAGVAAIVGLWLFANMAILLAVLLTWLVGGR